VLRNFFGVSETTLSTSVGGMDDSLMRAWYSKHLYSDQGLSSLTERMQSYLHHKLDQEVTAGSQTVDMYAWLSAFIFEASMAALLTTDSPTLNPELLANFNAFDKALPLALAGCPVSYLSAAAKGRQAMYAIAQDASDRRDKTCALMEKRFDLFQSLQDKGDMAPGDDLAMQLAIMWASVGNTIPTAFWLVYFLTAEGEASEDIRAAVLAEVSSGHITGADGCLSYPQEKLTSMVTLDACITETLRLCSGSMIMREGV
jgi:oxysterol 7-alpha-hydroxylase